MRRKKPSFPAPWLAIPEGGDYVIIVILLGIIGSAVVYGLGFALSALGCFYGCLLLTNLYDKWDPPQ